MRKLHTRQDFVTLLTELIEPLKPFYSPQKAGLKLGATSAYYRDEVAQMEGFARVLWGLTPLFAGGTANEEFATLYRQGLINGTDPDSPEYWGETEQYDQMLVEMAALAYGLIFARATLWDPLSKAEQDNVYHWLNQINHCRCYDCNWRFFNVLVNTAFIKLGRPHNQEWMEDSLAYIEECYLGDGWYQDGVGGMADYYVPFAIHFYSLLYSHAMKEEDPQRAQLFVARAQRFGQDFIYWFAPDGAAIPYGRSLTYRFAQVAFFSVCVATKTEVFSLAVMKGLIVRHLNYWCAQNIFDPSHLLTIGYAYPNLTMQEGYNAPGSPYWALKAFACLALPSTDEFWHVTAAELPELPERALFQTPEYLIQRRADGNVCFFPGQTSEHKHTHTAEKYDKFIYSTKYGFSVLKTNLSLAEVAPDNTTCFKIFGQFFLRTKATLLELSAETIKTEWSPLPGIEVETTIKLTAFGHLRQHRIVSAFACEMYDSGFAEAQGQGQGSETVRVLAVQGAGAAFEQSLEPNTNLLHTQTTMKTCCYQIVPGEQVVETHFYYD